jgi:putative glutamine amidotransferase
MKILISQVEHLRPPRYWPADSLERSYYKFLQGHELIPVPNNIKVPDIEYDCLILTGGPDSVARNQTENLLYENAVEKGKPVVGVCHGAFVINDMSKGVNGHVDGHVDAEIKITMEGAEHAVRCYHSQAIEKLGDGFEPIAFDTEGGIEAFKHVSKPIYGILWHPERMNNPVLPTEVKKLLD